MSDRVKTLKTYARARVLKSLDKLNPSELDVDITTQRGVRKRETMLMMLLSEIPHHEGQIAYIRGAVGRRRLTEPSFLV